ncbi:MAG: pentapeptide repeat-containing protein [Pseudanabaena sp.]
MGVNALEVDHLLELYRQGQRNFSNIDLSNAQLRSVTLTGIDLRGSTLNNADLSSANLIDANLTGANLIETNLRGNDCVATAPPWCVGGLDKRTLHDG